MSDLIPMNGLDQAIMAMQRSQAALPDLCRRLREGELWFLVPFHPEIEGEKLELKNGSPLPFAMVQDQAGEVVPVFSSAARLEEGLERGRVPKHLYSAGSLPAVQLLEILGKSELRAVINKSCATGEITLPANLMRDVADGSALKPLPVEGQKRGKVKRLDPADHPTNLLQPVFEFIRRHRNFRAAWVFDAAACAEQPVVGRAYQLLFLMSPRDPAVFHDLNLTVQAAGDANDYVGLGLLDETNAASIAQVFRLAPPFYTAADYQRPPDAKDGPK